MEGTSKKLTIYFVNQQYCPQLPKQPSRRNSFSAGKLHWHCGMIEMRMGDAFISSLLYFFIAFGETATHEGCPLASIIHWKNRRPQCRDSYRLSRSQLASKRRISSIRLNIPSFPIPRPSCCTLCLYWPHTWPGFWVYGRSSLGSGLCSLMAIQVLSWREDARLETSSRVSLGENNVCEGNTCEFMPLFLQIYISLFLWKGGCKLGAKWKPEPVVFGAHLAITLENFMWACMWARQWLIRLLM